MEKLVPHRFIFEISAVLLIALLCLIFFVVPNRLGNRRVDQFQQAAILQVQKAHLLGAGKPEVMAFFKRQNNLPQKSYGTLQGEAWEEYQNSKVTPSTPGTMLTGRGGVIATTASFLGCEKSWVVETCVLFDGKGKVMAVEVRPTYFGCDI